MGFSYLDDTTKNQGFVIRHYFGLIVAVYSDLIFFGRGGGGQ